MNKKTKSIQALRTLIRRRIFTIINYLLNYVFILKIFNYIYERLPYSALNKIVTYIKKPKKDYFWKIKLYNGKTVNTKIYKNDDKTWQFALSYKWHNRALNFIENILDEYYSKDVPWIDIGSNLGLRSLTALSSGRPVYMFEPNKEVNSLNEERCQLNNFRNYKIIELAVSSKNGEELFYFDKSSYLSSFAKNNISLENIVKKESVKTITLDTYFSLNKITLKNLCIKIDVEGHELEVIKGCQALINNVSPAFIIEINEKGEHIIKIISYFFSLGYEIYELASLGSHKILKQIKLCEDRSINNWKMNDFLMLKSSNLKRYLTKYIY